MLTILLPYQNYQQVALAKTYAVARMHRHHNFYDCTKASPDQPAQILGKS